MTKLPYCTFDFHRICIFRKYSHKMNIDIEMGSLWPGQVIDVKETCATVCKFQNSCIKIRVNCHSLVKKLMILTEISMFLS